LTYLLTDFRWWRIPTAFGKLFQWSVKELALYFWSEFVWLQLVTLFTCYILVSYRFISWSPTDLKIQLVDSTQVHAPAIKSSLYLFVKLDENHHLHPSMQGILPVQWLLNLFQTSRFTLWLQALGWIPSFCEKLYPCQVKKKS